MYCRAVSLHQVTSIWFLLIADFDHKDLNLNPKERTCHRQRRTPLASSCLGRDLLHAFLFVIEDLSYRGISLMAPYRANPLILVVNTGGSIQHLLQSTRA